MNNNYNMTYKTKHGNIIDLAETLFITEENCYVGNYELVFTFYNKDLGYYLNYHKSILFNKDEDYIDIYIDDNLVEPDIETYWNETKLNEMVNTIKEECYTKKINYVLDEMDKFNEYLYDKYKGFEEVLKKVLA